MSEGKGESQAKRPSTTAETQPPRNDLKEEQGGPQANQLSGQTDTGAHNQEAQNRNPRGENADRNQSDRQEGSNV